MSLLQYNSVPAERSVGCVFAENFESNWHVQENGGAISGSPVINHGATFDGAADYITYRLQGHEFNAANISIVIEFYPDFNYSDNVECYFIDSTDPYRYIIYKKPIGGGYQLDIYLGNTQIASILPATYGGSWLQSERNVLVVSGTSGATNAWLNGTQILTSDASAWTPDAPTELYVGSRFNATGLFDGVISSVKVFQSLLTGEDAENYYTHGGV